MQSYTFLFGKAADSGQGPGFDSYVATTVTEK